MTRPRLLQPIVWALVACAVALGAPAVAQAATPNAQLLRTYQPVTQFDPAERFRPASVQSFVADADLERFDGSGWVVVDRDPEPGTLPGPGTGIWRLNQDSCTPTAPLGGLACYAAAWEEGAGGSVVYGRVARLPNAVVLQYWFFYHHNVYSYLYPPTDFMWQAHEGDWEVVNVVLTEDERPVEVAYSQHCLGERRAWAATPRWRETHPVVYVAAGSHANYFTAGTHQFNRACVPPEVLALLARNDLPLPVDYTGNGDVAGPPQAGGDVTTIRRAAGERTKWVAFPGFWGELQYFHAPTVGTVPFGTSPVGPFDRPLWRDPLGTLATWPTG